MFSRQHPCCFICKEKLQTARVTRHKTKHTAGSHQAAFYRLNLQWKDKKNTCKQHALTREHTPTKKELQYTHLTRTHSQSHISWQILIQPHERMHQSPAFFPPSSTKIPLSHRSNRYVYSTHRISLTARLAHATLILER